MKIPYMYNNLSSCKTDTKNILGHKIFFFPSYLQPLAWTWRGWVWRCSAQLPQCSGCECTHKRSMLYTDTQETGGAWTGGRSLLLAQKLTALTQLWTQTGKCTNALIHACKHTHTQSGQIWQIYLCCLLLSHLCEQYAHTFTHSELNQSEGWIHTRRCRDREWRDFYNRLRRKIKRYIKHKFMS